MAGVTVDMVDREHVGVTIGSTNIPSTVTLVLILTLMYIQAMHGLLDFIALCTISVPDLRQMDGHGIYDPNFTTTIQKEDGLYPMVNIIT